MSAIYLRYPGGKLKALTFSYDDGVETDKRLIDIFKKHNLKGTFNINSLLFAPKARSIPKAPFTAACPKANATKPIKTVAWKWPSTAPSISFGAKLPKTLPPLTF